MLEATIADVSQTKLIAILTKLNINDWYVLCFGSLKIIFFCLFIWLARSFFYIDSEKKSLLIHETTHITCTLVFLCEALSFIYKHCRCFSIANLINIEKITYVLLLMFSIETYQISYLTIFNSYLSICFYRFFPYLSFL